MRRGTFKATHPGGMHTLAYTEFGPPDSTETVICVHGLTRNGRDFDALAGALSTNRVRVICPDIAGRGMSEWLPNAEYYNNEQYCADMSALINALAPGPVDWIGTSMGGIIGMMLAAGREIPIRRLVVNDIGPVIPAAGLARIAEFVGADPTFTDIAELEDYLRQVHAPFGITDDGQWRHLADHSARPLTNGRLGLAYDPRIGDAFRQSPDQPTPEQDIVFWPIWDAIECPVLVLRGETSDILSAETAAEMRRRGPRATVVEIQECGHAPSLMANEHIVIIRDWLFGHATS
jgi:pimeloyl-ACP methyl ester carboxylesterase